MNSVLNSLLSIAAWWFLIRMFHADIHMEMIFTDNLSFNFDVIEELYYKLYMLILCTCTYKFNTLIYWVGINTCHALNTCAIDKILGEISTFLIVCIHLVECSVLLSYHPRICGYDLTFPLKKKRLLSFFFISQEWFN